MTAAMPLMPRVDLSVWHLQLRMHAFQKHQAIAICCIYRVNTGRSSLEKLALSLSAGLRRAGGQNLAKLWPEAST